MTMILTGKISYKVGPLDKRLQICIIRHGRALKIGFVMVKQIVKMQVTREIVQFWFNTSCVIVGIRLKLRKVGFI